MNKIISLIKIHKIKSIIIVVLFIWYYFSLPQQLFTAPTSTVIESADGQLLGAQIATDGQWRFPHTDGIPTKFSAAIVAFEDAYFYKHPGFNPVSIVKAFWKNIKSGSVKRGGSTLTQQVIRLSRKGKSRTYYEKFIEIILASRLEFRHSKDDILGFYAANAPFGGNVVGLDVAAWRYFGRNPNDLSWAESATLAVLPNAPSLIYPGKNQQRLLEKRNRLLKKLFEEETIDELTYELAVQEKLPQKPYPLPQIAPHLLQVVNKSYTGKRIKTSLNKAFQQRVNNIVKSNYNILQQNQIHNIGVLVLDVKTRKVMAYVGNSPTDIDHQKDVDVIDKPRSTGSILKPFLYTAMLDAGEILPNTLVADVPTQIASYNPKNFNLEYDGAVPASRALSRSLNVPSVRMLQNFGLDRFHHYIKELGLTDIKYNANHYGLSLILGGAESNLWDLCKSYAAMSSTINHYDKTSGNYYTNEFVNPTFLNDTEVDFGKISTEKTIFDAGSIYMTYQSLKEVNRPEGEENWEFFDSSKEIAWKTGTSFGFRDAWAIGSTKDYVVGVWVGNADGEGRPGLVGVSTAAPIMFNIFDVLPRSEWFTKPFDELEKIPICSKSGFRASEICERKDSVFVQRAGLKTRACPYHLWIHLDENAQHQVNSSCYPINKMKHTSWFVLPPLQAFYYQSKNPSYKTLPPFLSGCITSDKAVMDFIYPKKSVKVFLPKDFNENTNQLVFRLAHNIPDIKVYWYLNDQFMGTTQAFHELAVSPKNGKHMVTAVDELGNEIKREIEITD